MAFVVENNRIYATPEGQVTITGNAGPTVPLIARIFIDLGIAIGTVVAAIASAGTSLIPESSVLAGTALATILPETVSGAVGLAGSLAGLSVNTAIDVGEGRTDLLTLGLDIGLPFATELLGAGLQAGFKSISLGEKLSTNILSGALDKSGVDSITKSQIMTIFEKTDGSSIRTIQGVVNNQQGIISKVSSIATEEAGRKGLQKLLPTPALDAFDHSLDSINKTIKSLDATVEELNATFRSLTDSMDKVAGSIKDYLMAMLPRIKRIIDKMKAIIARLKKVFSYVTNPVGKLSAYATTKAKAMIKYISQDETKMMYKLKTIKQRLDIQKQSILQNSLITQNNIQTVNSTWILGYSIVATETDDDGKITNGHLIWWFVPERTAHDGSRGATPEPYGKKPVAMLNLTQDEMDDIISGVSMGTYYLNEVSEGKFNTALAQGAGAIRSDVDSNWLAALFKNSLSIIPGYSLFMSVKGSIGQMKGYMDKIVSGTMGTDYLKSLTNYQSALTKMGSALMPKQVTSAAKIVMDGSKNGGSDDYAKLLQPAVNQANTWTDNISKHGIVQHVKNI